MLGRTNLTTVEKGTIISDIEDYRWDNFKINGINENFIRVIYANNVLVAITQKGVVAHTKDGENWECKTLQLDNGDFFELTDIVYGDGKYVIVGYHTDQETYMHGLIFISEDLIEYEMRMCVEEEHFKTNLQYTKFLSVSYSGNSFIICYTGCNKQASTSNAFVSLYYTVTDLERTVSADNACGISLHKYSSASIGGLVFPTDFYKKPINTIFSSARKTDGTFIFYAKIVESSSGAADSDAICILSKDMRCSKIYENVKTSSVFSVFECRDRLYFATNEQDADYEVARIVGNSDKETLSTGIAYGFVDTVYFNKCEVFINNHEMLVVKPGENIADKNLNDMVEITYDFSIMSIIKAFDKLYIFGTGGNILVSDDEANNEAALAVKAMSASRALYEAKAYTDKRIEELRNELTNGS